MSIVVLRPTLIWLQVEAVSGELQTLQAQNLALKKELYQEMEGGNVLRAELLRSRQLSYSAYGLAIAAALTALWAVRLHRPQ